MAWIHTWHIIGAQQMLAASPHFLRFTHYLVEIRQVILFYPFSHLSVSQDWLHLQGPVENEMRNHLFKNCEEFWDGASKTVNRAWPLLSTGSPCNWPGHMSKQPALAVRPSLCRTFSGLLWASVSQCWSSWWAWEVTTLAQEFVRFKPWLPCLFSKELLACQQSR